MKCNAQWNGEAFPETLDNKVSNSGFVRVLAQREMEKRRSPLV